MNSYVKSNTMQRGFTLIELVVVIVILGILAAFAVPKFIGLESQARTSSVRALQGTLLSANAMAHGLAMAMGQTGATGNVTINGANVAVVWGYPSRASITSFIDSSIVNTAQGKFTYTAGTGTFTLNGATTPASCSVIYTAATSANVPSTVSNPTVSGC